VLKCQRLAMGNTGTTEDQVLGCLLGGALGDAWGGPWEGRLGPLPFETPLQSKISDDTQLTLATCESVVEKGSVDPENLAAHFLDWFVRGRITGIGASTLKSMRDLSAGVHWALAGNRGEFAAGNGAAMRIAPLAFVLDPLKASDRTVIRDVCRITHHNEESYVGALAVLVAIRAIATGGWSGQKSLLSIVVDALPDSAVRDRIEQFIGLKIKPEEAASRFGASGYVVETVPLALSYAQHIAEESLTAVLARAIRAGGDTDTIASITGQIAGTAVGAKSISRDLFDDIDAGEEIFQISGQFARLVVLHGAER
jgi:ADP-ribosyl-[dinitrogen reductase] hydrolase